VGTTVSTFTVGGLMYGVCQLVPHLANMTFIDNLHFGALISATDPVTVLAIFRWDIQPDQQFCCCCSCIY
jgi:sodium/hydrogen exchanger-like protein 6/7